MSKLIGNYIDSKMKSSWKMMEEWQSTIYSMMVFGATMVVMFWASVFLYTSFYFTYMPQESITWPIHLQYRSCGDQPGICSFPNSLVSVTDPNRGGLLARGQKYRVVVDLEMPESPTNQKTGTAINQMSGMFLITMEMRAFTGDVLRKASRSSMLRYKSPLLQAMATFIFAPFLLYGAHEEKQLVTAELFSQYEEDPVTPLSDVFIEIASRNIEVYSAQLRIHATFAGLRHFMYYYPVTAAVFGIGVCMVFLSLIVLFSWYQFSLPAEKMIFGSGGDPNGYRSVEDITKEDFEKDAKEGTGDSRCTSSASETSYSPAQMETNTEVEGSGWISFLSQRPSSRNDDTKENNTSRRTSSHNIAAFVARDKSSPNASCSSSRRSSIRKDNTVEETSKKTSSFFGSIVGALTSPEDTKDDSHSITLEVPPVRSRRVSDSSAKGESTSKRSSWIFDGNDSDKDTAKDQEDKLLQQSDDLVGKEETSTSKRSSWRFSWFGDELKDEAPEITEESYCKEEVAISKQSSWLEGDIDVKGTDEEISVEDPSFKISTDVRRPSILETMFGISVSAEQAQQDVEAEAAEKLKESDNMEEGSINKRSSWRGGDISVQGTDEEKNSNEDSSLKVSVDERRPSILETMFGISLSAVQTQEDELKLSKSQASSRKSSVGSFKTSKYAPEPTDSMEEGSINKRSSWLGGDISIQGTDEEKNSNEDSSLKVSVDERRPSIIETMFGISFSAVQPQEDLLNLPKSHASSRKSSVGSIKNNTDNQEITSMTKSISRRSSRGSTRDTIKHEELEVPNIKSSSRRSSTGQFRDDISETSGRQSPRDVALVDAARLLDDANLVLRRRSSIKDSSIKRISSLLDEGSSSSRRRSSTSDYAPEPSDTQVNRRKSSTSFIKHLLTKPSDNDEVERSSSRDDSKHRKLSTNTLSVDPTEESTAKQSRSQSVSSDRSEVVHRRSPSPFTRGHVETNSEDQPPPVSGRLSHLFQESVNENLAPSSDATGERRPSFIESMMGILIHGGETTTHDEPDNEEEKNL